MKKIKQVTLAALLTMTAAVVANETTTPMPPDASIRLTGTHLQYATAACNALSGTMENLGFEYSTKLARTTAAGVTKTSKIYDVCKTKKLLIQFAFDGVSKNPLAEMAMASHNEDVKDLQPALFIINTEKNEGLRRDEAVLIEGAKDYDISYAIIAPEIDNANFYSDVIWARHSILADTRGKKAETAEQAKDRATSQLNIADEALIIAYDQFQQGLITQEAYDAAALNQAAKQSEYDYQLARHIVEYEKPKPAVLTSTPLNVAQVYDSLKQISNGGLWVDTDGDNAQMLNLDFTWLIPGVPIEGGVNKLSMLRKVAAYMNNRQAVFDMDLTKIDDTNIQFTITSLSAGATSWIRVNPLINYSSTKTAAIFGFTYDSTANGAEPVYVAPEQRIKTEVKTVEVEVIKEVAKVVAPQQAEYNSAIKSYKTAIASYYGETYQQVHKDLSVTEANVTATEDAYVAAYILYQRSVDGTSDREEKEAAMDAALWVYVEAKAVRDAAKAKVDEVEGLATSRHQAARDNLAKAFNDLAWATVSNGGKNESPITMAAWVKLQEAKAALKVFDDKLVATATTRENAKNKHPTSIEYRRLERAVQAKTVKVANYNKIYKYTAWLHQAYIGCSSLDCYCGNVGFESIPWSEIGSEEMADAALIDLGGQQAELVTLQTELDAAKLLFDAVAIKFISGQI